MAANIWFWVFYVVKTLGNKCNDHWPDSNKNEILYFGHTCSFFFTCFLTTIVIHMGRRRWWWSSRTVLQDGQYAEFQAFRSHRDLKSNSQKKFWNRDFACRPYIFDESKKYCRYKSYKIFSQFFIIFFKIFCTFHCIAKEVVCQHCSVQFWWS